jgi:succinylarginine dihydrolase
MTILDPISGRQIMIDPSGKPYPSIIRQEGFPGGEQQVRAGQVSCAGEESKSPDLPSQNHSRERCNA